MARSSPILVFAYGSNMCAERMSRRVPSARPVGTALAPGWRLAFDKRGMDGSGKGNIRPKNGRDGEALHGVLYRVDFASVLAELDPFEHGYEHVWVSTFVSSRAAPRRALCYKARPEFVSDRLPFDWYVALIRSGARSAGLPRRYLEYLDRIETRTDPDPIRRAEHWPVEC